MKIAYLIHDFRRFEGQGRYTVELATRASREHEVHVFASSVERGADCDAIRFHHIRAWRKNALTTVMTFAWSARPVLSHGFDVVHAQGFCTFGGDLLTAHICNRTWHRALNQSLGGLTPKEKIYDQVTKRLEGASYRNPQLRRVIAVSERVARDVRNDYGCQAPIDVIPHGVDLELFHPSSRSSLGRAARLELGLPEDAFTFLYVGDLRKGGRYCLEALAKTPEAHFIFVSRSALDTYREQALTLGVAERAHFLAPTTHINRYYAASDAFVLPTPYDAFAMVVTEAMAAGLPVIVSREAGASELITPGFDGLLLERHNDVPALVHAMQTLAGDKAATERIGANARVTAEQYSWGAVARRTFAVYEQIASSN